MRRSADSLRMGIPWKDSDSEEIAPSARRIPLPKIETTIVQSATPANVDGHGDGRIVKRGRRLTHVDV